MNVAKNTGPILAAAAQSVALEQDSARVTDKNFWPSLLMTVALTSIAVGITWDISWHESIGRDTFWTPAHMAIYLGGVLAGCVAGWLAIKHTFFATPAERDASVSVFGARAPLGAWVVIWGALDMVTSAPFDNWWHNAYGLDVKIISPPHAVLGLGMLFISVGVLLLVLRRQNLFAESSTRGSGLFIYAGGVFVLLGSVFILEYIFPNEQHGRMFFIVCAMAYPARLVALGYAARVSWPATRVAAVYMGLLCSIDWILTLFPAQPRLAPIFNPITHMVPLPFPLLLVFPALAVDLVLMKTRHVNGILRLALLTILLSSVFLVVFMPVQWFFAKFMISPAANNWFFMGNRIFGYNITTGDWHYQFWHRDRNGSGADVLTIWSVVLTWIIAAIGSGLGLFFGRWMRKIRR